MVIITLRETSRWASRCLTWNTPSQALCPWFTMSYAYATRWGDVPGYVFGITPALIPVIGAEISEVRTNGSIKTSKSWDDEGHKDCLHWKYDGAVVQGLPPEYVSTNVYYKHATVTGNHYPFYDSDDLPPHTEERITLFRTANHTGPTWGRELVAGDSRAVWGGVVPVVDTLPRGKDEINFSFQTVGQRVRIGAGDSITYPGSEVWRICVKPGITVCTLSYPSSSGYKYVSLTYTTYARTMFDVVRTIAYESGNIQTVASTLGTYPVPSGTGRVDKRTRIALSNLRTHYSGVWPNENKFVDEHLPQLVTDALANYQFLAMNSSMFIRDCIHLKEAIKPLLWIKKRPTDRRAWASLWLTYRYGIRLFLMDCKKVYDSYEEYIRRQPDGASTWAIRKARSRASGTGSFAGTEVDAMSVLHMYSEVEPGAFMDLITLLRQSGLYVSAADAWDWIPYSFVIDWFIPVQKSLASIDTANDLTLYSVTGVAMSVKFQKVIDEPLRNLSGVVGQVAVGYYHRFHMDPDLARLKASFSQDYLDGISLTHFVDGAALVVQRRG